VHKSWAVTRGPSLDPKDKRLAVEVEDHPLDYGDFEGVIPQGEYGGGTVMLWDRGYWSPEDSESPQRSLEKGELKFAMAGQKLRGSWVLVRMNHDRNGRNRSNWLLIKHKDKWAGSKTLTEGAAASKSVASGRTMKQIAAGKGPKPVPFIEAESTPRGRARSQKRRPDKSDAAPEPAPARRSFDGARVLGVAISKPQKVLWPAAGQDSVSKLDLAKYLESVAPWMLNHIRSRPCSVLRAPDGIDGGMFFQRHGGNALPDAVDTVTIAGDRQPYLEINSETALVAMAQLAALEFHPWNSPPHDPDVAGRLIFDLDPGPGVTFTDVVSAAKELRARLEKLGLEAFCKTTGGKGLHVVVPLDASVKDRMGWDEAKMFARAVSLQMEDDTPSRYLTSMSKAKRQGRIFLDYLRNDRMATAVAPLSPRARAGALVSMPLNWAQVRSDLDPVRFTIHTAPAMLQKSTPWDGYAAAGVPLKSAIQKLFAKP
jgi:bifunctional non-homologous end joining protein LigD